MNFKLLLAASALAISAVGASAATITAQYNVTSAENGAFGPGSGGHSVWLPSETPGGGSADHFDFDMAGSFQIFDDGSATLTGTAVHETSGAANGFTVSANFQLATNGPYAGKRELSNAAYSDTGGGPIDVSTWEFYNLTSGTLTGFGSFSGRVLGLSEAPSDGSAPFQIGFGANGKNTNFGGSGWFYYTAGAGTPQYRGDFNVDLAAVPLPASMLLLMGGIGGLGLMRKRKAAA